MGVPQVREHREDDWVRDGLAGRRTLLFALVCSLYLLAALLREDAVRALFGQQATTAPNFIATHAFSVQAIQLALLVPPTWLLFGSLLAGNQPYGTALRARSRTVTSYLALTFLISMVLNATALWPFSWRWESGGSAAHMHVLMQHDRSAIVLWAISGIVLIPILEESIFRFWMLREIARRTRSYTVAVVGSSLLFAALHLGSPVYPPDRAHMVNAGWLFAFSLLVGTITVRRRGNFAPVLAMHVGRNALEFATLAVSVSGGYAN